mmetsp:Transcript_1137/g.3648  ORF Transcript_1137/g.3648 Transcript_1137/m.3648 type:complete len:202 (+) Transcript_1137:781-1386(+)
MYATQSSQDPHSAWVPGGKDSAVSVSAVGVRRGSRAQCSRENSQGRGSRRTRERWSPRRRRAATLESAVVAVLKRRAARVTQRTANSAKRRPAAASGGGAPPGGGAGGGVQRALPCPWPRGLAMGWAGRGCQWRRRRRRRRCRGRWLPSASRASPPLPRPPLGSAAAPSSMAESGRTRRSAGRCRATLRPWPGWAARAWPP